MQKFTVLVFGAMLAVGSTAVLTGDTKGDPEKGKEVFQQCGVCHNADSTEKKMGPGLKGLFTRDKMNNGKKPTETNVREKVDEGGNGMPAYKEMLSDDEKNDLIAYLKTLENVRAKRAKGQRKINLQIRRNGVVSIWAVCGCV